MNPMSRFALFAICLLALVAIAASQPRRASLTKSMNDMCVCVPTRAKLMMKEAITKTRASAKLFASNVTAAR